jgi:hypothetical protein
MVVGTIDKMKAHVLESHEISMTPGEELLMFDFEQKYKKEQKEKGIFSAEAELGNTELFDSDFDSDFENLDDLFAEWMEVREKNKDVMSDTRCVACEETFNQTDSHDTNVRSCFIHEVDCCALSELGIEAYTCGLCGTMYSTVLQREICEMEHAEDV